MRSGDSLRVVVRAADPDGSYIRDGQALASVCCLDDMNPLHQQRAVWDNKARGYVTVMDTTGWPPGTYALTGVVYGLRGVTTVRGTSAPAQFTVTAGDTPPASDS